MKKLDKLLEAVMKEKAELINQEANEDDREQLIAALRDKMRMEIIDEIRTEYKNELKEEANTELQEELNKNKLDKIKELMWSGFILAFLVGIAVNQVTDLIGFCKGTIEKTAVWQTIVILVVLVAICVVAYLYTFFSQAIKILHDDKNKKKNEDLDKNA